MPRKSRSFSNAGRATWTYASVARFVSSAWSASGIAGGNLRNASSSGLCAGSATICAAAWSGTSRMMIAGGMKPAAIPRSMSAIV